MIRERLESLSIIGLPLMIKAAEPWCWIGKKVRLCGSRRGISNPEALGITAMLSTFDSPTLHPPSDESRDLDAMRTGKRAMKEAEGDGRERGDVKQAIGQSAGLQCRLHRLSFFMYMHAACCDVVRECRSESMQPISTTLQVMMRPSCNMKCRSELSFLLVLSWFVSRLVRSCRSWPDPFV